VFHDSILLSAVAWALLLSAIATYAIAWGWFRKPGERIRLLIPVSRVRDVLTPDGVMLMAVSLLMALASGVAALFNRLG